MLHTFRFLIGFSLCFSLVACVSANKHDELQSRHDKLQLSFEEAENKINELETLIAELERKLGDASANRKSMSQSIQQMKDALKEASDRKREVEKRLSEFRKLVQRFKSLTDAGELSIMIRDGRMVVVLPSDVLFSSGSSSLSAKGQGTIKKVGQLLASITDKQFQVEGHTDNVPINSAQFPSNWELASARAMRVLRLLIEAGLPENRVSAASFGETKPVASNDTSEGKSLNRRIDIVIIPDLSLLPGYEELRQYSDKQ
jgi:chemotaxis protein MotB